MLFRSLLTDNNRLHKHGSGVGLMNINNRIKLLFGAEYGLSVESEPDEGTVVSICIPAVPFTEENRKKLEEGRPFGDGGLPKEQIQLGKEEPGEKR